MNIDTESQSASEAAVLAVDDRPENLLSIQAVLGDMELDLVTAQSGPEALRMSLDRDFAVILLDVQMPEMDGFQVAELIHSRERSCHTPIIYLTATNQSEQDMFKGYTAGAVDYLIKPLSPHILRSKVKVYVDLYKKTHQLQQAQETLLLLTESLEDQVQRRTQELQESNNKLEAALDQLQQAQSKLISQERLHALGQMASGIAHDFNNALTPILGYSDLLMDRTDLLANRDKAMQSLKLINTAAKDAAKIVNRLREFYRNRDKNEVFVPIDLNEIVEQAISLTQPRWKGQTQVIGKEVNVAIGLEKIPPICGSEAELREALTNLIFNAIDAMPDGGTITIRSRLESDIVVLEMSDTGIGMTEEVRRRCLEPFFSTKGERGTGLGLAMVSGIIRRHEATLEVESEPGKGTTFIIRLPTGTGEKTPAEEQQEEAAPVQLHILVVDDEPHVRDVIVGYFSQDGHTVATASSGSEGLRKFRASAFDLIVTDRAMPELSGEQLALVVKKIRPSTPVILLTDYGDLMKFSDELPEGVDLIVSKPPTLNSLRDAVIKAFGFASRLSKPGTSRGLLLHPADKLMTSPPAIQRNWYWNPQCGMECEK